MPEKISPKYGFSRYLARLKPSPQTSIVIAVVLLWRFCLENINQFLVPLINSSGGVVRHAASGNFGLIRWLYWDGGWYLSVITQGYKYVYQAPPVPQNIAFFPAFPLLVKVGHEVTNIAYPYIGGLINLALTVGVAYFIYKLWIILKSRYGNNKNAESHDWLLPVVLVLSLPTAFYFAAFYAEALLVFCILGALFFSFKKKYLFAAIFAGCATATNVIGLAAMPTMLLIFLEQETNLKSGIKSAIKNPLKFIGIAIAGIWGLLAFMLYLWVRFKDPLAFYKDEQAWGRLQGNPFPNLWNTFYEHFFDFRFFGGHINYLIALTDMLVPVLAIAFIMYAIYKKVWWLVGYAFIMLVLPLSSGNLSSINRYALTLSPCIVYLCAVSSERLQKYFWLMVPILAVIQLILVAVFLQGSHLYFVG